MSVRSERPKLMPLIDTRTRPEVGPLRFEEDVTTGASNVIAKLAVPTTEATVATTRPPTTGVAGDLPYMRLVPDDQLTVPHARSEPRRTLGLAFVKPKFSPEIVTLSPAVEA